MQKLSPNTPVIVGIGSCQIKDEDPLACPEAIQLMLTAIHQAASNTGYAQLPERFESIGVQKGSWKYSNPGKLLAEELGCPSAKSILADLGVLQLMPFFELCDAIQRGQQQVGVVTGGEARFRELRSLITGQQVEETEQGEETPAPDIYHAIPDPFSSELESARGVWSPGEFYAIADSAMRHHRGSSIEKHRDDIAELYSIGLWTDFLKNKES